MSQPEPTTHASALRPETAAEPDENGRIPVRRALLSVYDKAGLTELARGLCDAGVQIVSTGRTARHLESGDIPVTPIENLTGFPEMLDGRVKTLHPHVHAAILADRRNPEHVRQLAERGLEPFDLVVSNLYPFREAVDSGADEDATIEQIDIGGPSMVRGAAKNHASVAVVVDPASYADVVRAVRAGGFTLAERRSLAAKAFAHTAAYDVAVAGWFARAEELPAFLGLALDRVETLRYGENPHQAGALYVNRDAPGGLAQAEQSHGKEMSYNNYVDADAARRAAFDFADPCVAIVKHANPCGIATGADIAEAHRKAHACDPVSAFGGVIATNRPVSVAMAEQVAKILTDVIVAPAYQPGAREILTGRKNIRVLTCPPPAGGPRIEVKAVTGGMLAQTTDRIDAPGDDPAAWRLVAGDAVDAATLADLAFAWRAIRAVKSNAILLARDAATVGCGMGQVNRVDAARLAVSRAGERASGAVAASDAFFPFPDGLQVLIDAGVRAVVEPGGSVRDEEVIAAARSAGLPLYFTGTRHFFH